VKQVENFCLPIDAVAESSYINVMEKRELEKILSAFGRYRASKRRRVDSQCVICGKPIHGLVTRMYCSAACSQKAYRERLKARVQEESPSG